MADQRGLGFAVVRRGSGLAVFRREGDRMRLETSPDGLSWESADVVTEEARDLWPVCAGTNPEEAEVFCADAAGRLVGMRTSERGVILGASCCSIPAPEQWYEGPPDPRELEIVRDLDSPVYHAFFPTRRRTGRDPLRRGCIGAARSSDLQNWVTDPPVFAPNLFEEMLSPHLFSEQGRAILFYATPEEGQRRAIRFAWASRLEGPYERPDPDLIARDARTCLRTVQLGGRLLVFFGRLAGGETGRIAISRPGMLEFGADGRPIVRFYDRLLGLLGRTLFQTSAALNSAEMLVRVVPRYATDFRLNARLTSRGASAVGLLVRTSMTGHDNLTIWLDYRAGAVVVRRGVKGRLLARCARRLSTGETYRVSIWVEGGFADVFVDDEWLITVETEGRMSGGFGFAVAGGEGRFDEATAQVLKPAD